MIFNLPETSTSLVKQHLTRDLVKTLEQKTTDTDFTLAKAVQSAIENPDSAIGIYAGDPQSYTTFAPLLDPIIRDYHCTSKQITQNHNLKPVLLQDPDPDKQFILSTRVRVARNIRGYNFTNHIDLSSRKLLEKTVIDALAQLNGNLEGKYHPFATLDDTQIELLKEQKLFFEKGDRFQEAAGINRDFPECRGIFHSSDKKFRVWLNEEDHLRIISQDASSDLTGVFNRLCQGLQALEKKLDFVKDKRYGYLTSCPTNIGTSMRAGVHIHLNKLNQDRPLLTSLTKAHDLQIRGTSGEKTEVKNCVFDISNRQRLGITETDIIKKLHQGLLEIINTEKNL